jgi:hypothetical protein
MKAGSKFKVKQVSKQDFEGTPGYIISGEYVK